VGVGRVRLAAALAGRVWVSVQKLCGNRGVGRRVAECQVDPSPGRDTAVPPRLPGAGIRCHPPRGCPESALCLRPSRRRGKVPPLGTPAPPWRCAAASSGPEIARHSDVDEPGPGRRPVGPARGPCAGSLAPVIH